MSSATPVIVFFTLNPEEELSLQDMEVKFGITEQQRPVLQRAITDGWLTRTLRPDATSSRRKRYFYAAGPRLIEMGARA